MYVQSVVRVSVCTQTCISWQAAWVHHLGTLCANYAQDEEERESGLKDETGPQDVTSLYESRMKI